MDKKRRRARAGFSLVELLIVISIILVILMVALPKFTAATMGARETAVITAMRTLNTAQTQYMSQFGNYATTLAQLGPPPSGGSWSAGSRSRPLLSFGRRERRVSVYHDRDSFRLQHQCQPQGV